jgi:hypothetical protein
LKSGLANWKRLLRREAMEIEILKAAPDLARAKIKLLSPSPRPGYIR